MRRLNLHIAVVVILSWITYSCSDDRDNIYIDSDLSPYFERFALEGAKRGVIVDYEALHVEGFVQTIGEQNVVGQCSHTEEAPNAVIVDPILWQNASESKREQVIFHELGHCYLQRSHDDTKDANGVCLSIMHSNANICSINYALNRELYLDELFKN